MDGKQFEKRVTLQAGSETGEGARALDEVLESTGRVKEMIRENAGENAPVVIQKDRRNPSISQKIAWALFSHEERRVKPLPSVSEQRKLVEESLEHETDKLLREAKRLQKQKNFSASALEEIIRQIRHLQEIIAELFHMAAHQLEQLYRQYVAKGAQ